MRRSSTTCFAINNAFRKPIVSNPRRPYTQWKTPVENEALAKLPQWRSPGVQNRAMKLFEDTIMAARQPDPSPYIKSDDPMAEMYERILVARRKLEKSEWSPSECYSWFKKTILPLLDYSEIRNSRIVYDFVSKLLAAIVAQKKENPLDATLPSLSELYQAQIDFSKEYPIRFMRMLPTLLEYLTETSDPSAAISASERKIAILSDIGTFLLQVSRKGPIEESAAEPGQIDVSLGFVSPRYLQGRRRSFTGVLLAMLVRHNANQLPGLAPVLITISFIVKHEGLQSHPALSHMRPILQCVECLGQQLRLPEWKLRQEFGNHHALWKYVSPKLDQAWPTSPINSLRDLHAQVSGALSLWHVDEIIRLWERHLPALVEHDTGDGRSAKVETFDYFVFVFCALKKPEYVADVMKKMKTHGFPLTVRTYTSMIKGWKQAREPEKIEALWATLHARREPLDSAFWAARLSTLAEFGRLKEAVEALYEMGRLWDEAVEKDMESTAVPPSIEPINAILTQVILTQGIKGAQPLLTWAASRNIPASIVTYNILLKHLLKAAEDLEVSRILSEMKAQNIEPDETTFTIIISEIMARLQNESLEKQLDTVMGIFDQMKLSNQLRVVEVYASILNTILKNGKEATQIAQTIITHMKQNRLTPSPHICTMLIDHYFSLHPPDITAVKQLISTCGPQDRVFQQRLIDGYARNGYTADAMREYFRIRPEMPVALSVKNTLLQALLRDGNKADAARLVASAKERALKLNVDDRYWKHHFWHLAAENGLCARPGAPDRSAH